MRKRRSVATAAAMAATAAMVAACWCFAAGPASGPAGRAEGAEEELVLRGLEQMDYLVHSLSLWNLVNGMNLTPAQARKLQDLGRQMDAVAVKPPDLSAPIPPALVEVRKVYRELGAVLEAGKGVPADLEKRVVAARAEQAGYVRSTLRPAPVGDGAACADCHGVPARLADRERMNLQDHRAACDLGHALGDYGRAGLKKLVELSPAVTALLSDSQKTVFDDFVCCLLPPQSLDAPVRAGQAESVEKELDLLRTARSLSADDWPAGCDRILSACEGVLYMNSPSATPPQRKELRDRLRALLEKARSMGQQDFELAKDDLARQVHKLFAIVLVNSPHKAAYFLLVPGSPKVYGKYLQRKR